MSSEPPVKFPKQREELLRLCADDQQDLRQNLHAISLLKSESEKEQKYLEITKRCHARTHHMLRILNEIKRPTVKNIGMDGSEAILTITQHSYLPVMERVLALYEQEYQKNPTNICGRFIPALIDRIRILKHKKALFGTQWTIDKKGVPFLIAVEDFKNVNQRRASYGLEPIRRPINLAVGAIKYPLGKGLAKATDQRDLTKDEYGIYAKNQLESVL